MHFKLTPAYIRRQKAKLRNQIVISSVVMIALVFALFSQSELLSAMIFSTIIVGALSTVVLSCRKQLNFWNENGEKIEIEVVDGVLHQKYLAGEIQIQLSKIGRIIVQMRGSRVESIVVKSDYAESEKLEGYENMEHLRAKILKYVPPSKVDVTRWFHR